MLDRFKDAHARAFVGVLSVPAGDFPLPARNGANASYSLLAMIVQTNSMTRVADTLYRPVTFEKSTALGIDPHQ